MRNSSPIPTLRISHPRPRTSCARTAAWLCGLALTGAASAQSGSIGITGEISASTCGAFLSQPGNGSSANIAVTLPSIGTGAVIEPDSFAGQTAFSISFFNCSIARSGMATAYFNPGMANSQGRLNFSNHVDIELLNADGAPMLLNMPSGQQNASTAAVTAGSHLGWTYTLSFYARYRNKGQVGVSPVASKTVSITYDVVYP